MRDADCGETLLAKLPEDIYAFGQVLCSRSVFGGGDDGCGKLGVEEVGKLARLDEREAVREGNGRRFTLRLAASMVTKSKETKTTAACRHSIYRVDKVAVSAQFTQRSSP
jgi:hypothetical protein